MDASGRCRRLHPARRHRAEYVGCAGGRTTDPDYPSGDQDTADRCDALCSSGVAHRRRVALLDEYSVQRGADDRDDDPSDGQRHGRVDDTGLRVDPRANADAYILHIGTAPNTWDVLAAGLLTQPSYLVATVLPIDRTLYVRVGSRVGGIWRYSASAAFTAVRTTASLISPVASVTDQLNTRAFEWTPVPDADAYILHIGTAPNTWDVLAAGLLTQPFYLTTATLPTDRTLTPASAPASAGPGAGEPTCRSVSSPKPVAQLHRV